MHQPSSIEKLRYSVNKEISKNGIHIVALSKACDCEKCKEQGINNDNDLDDIFDGYIYSIGFHRLGLPEVLILTGSNGTEEGKLTKEQLNDRLQDAANYIRHIYENKDTFVFDSNRAQRSHIKDLWWVMANEEIMTLPEIIKHDLMSQATAYYGTCEYNVNVLMPHIHPHD